MAFQHLHQPGADDIARRGVGDVPAGETDLAAAFGDQSGDRVQCRAFACSIPSEQRDEFTLRDGKRDAVHDFRFAISDVQVFNFEKSAHAPRYTRMTSGSLRTSVVVPCAIMRPKLSAVTRSQTRNTKSV